MRRVDDAVDKESGKKVAALKREQDEELAKQEIRYAWSLLCGFYDQPVGDCECG